MKPNNSNSTTKGPSPSSTTTSSSSPYNATKSTYFTSLENLYEWYDEIINPDSGYNFQLDELKKGTEKLNSYQRIKSNPLSASTSPTKTDSNETASTAPSINPGTQLKNSSSTNAEDRIAATKLMICHDFMNGYQPNEDENPLGYFPHVSGRRYYLQYPQFIDKFVYFSHHRVSVPPSSWINICHKNGIKCFGTIIFEGNSLKDWEELDRLVTCNDGKSFRFIDPLVKLIDYFGFDGFLLNIETQFTNNKIGASLIPFIENLKTELHKMDAKNEVIWYDAYVHPYNRVYYMNGVSEQNYNFFESSDSFFTNYWWNIKHLQENIKNVGILGVVNKMFVGYDVWGRGSLIGKGGFDSSIACQIIQKYKSNIALFAPAWTYEYLGKRNFIENDTRFWIGLFDEESSIASSIQPFNSTVFKINDSSFSFYTNFSNGEGNRFFTNGDEIFSGNWVNSNLQFDIPINIRKKNKEHGLKWNLSTDDSFIGGSSLEIKYDEFIHDDGYQIYNDQLIQSMTLFKFIQECKFNTIGVKVTYKLNHKTQSIFKLKIKYYIERRYRSISKVRTGFLILPLISTSNKWFTINENFQISTKNSREYIILESVELSYDDDNINDNFFQSFTLENSIITSVIDSEEYEELISGDVYNDNEDEDWVLIPTDLSKVSTNATSSARIASSGSVSSSTIKKGKLQKDPILKVGELAIINGNNYPSDNYFNVSVIKKFSSCLINYNDGNQLLSDAEQEVLLRWNNVKNEGVAYYLVYIDDGFKGISHTNAFVFKYVKLVEEEGIEKGKSKGKDKKDKKGKFTFKTRVDSVDRIGNVFKGNEVMLSV